VHFRDGLARVYVFFTTSVYMGYRDNLPSIVFGSKKTRLSGKTRAKSMTANFGVPDQENKMMVERISDAILDTAPAAA
jgi:serine/threonine-protein kinase HipA